MENQNTQLFKAIADCIVDYVFGQAQYQFYEKCKAQIIADEENKLDYTPMFNEYAKMLDTHIEAQLRNKYTEEQIKAFYEEFKTNSKKYEAINSDTVEVLFTLIDLSKFKESVLTYKEGVKDT